MKDAPAPIYLIERLSNDNLTLYFGEPISINSRDGRGNGSLPNDNRLGFFITTFLFRVDDTLEMEVRRSSSIEFLLEGCWLVIELRERGGGGGGIGIFDC